jgi:hypothetical protein
MLPYVTAVLLAFHGAHSHLQLTSCKPLLLSTALRVAIWLASGDSATAATPAACGRCNLRVGCPLAGSQNTSKESCRNTACATQHTALVQQDQGYQAAAGFVLL